MIDKLTEIAEAVTGFKVDPDRQVGEVFDWGSYFNFDISVTKEYPDSRQVIRPTDTLREYANRLAEEKRCS